MSKCERNIEFRTGSQQQKHILTRERNFLGRNERDTGRPSCGDMILVPISTNWMSFADGCKPSYSVTSTSDVVKGTNA